MKNAKKYKLKIRTGVVESAGKVDTSLTKSLVGADVVALIFDPSSASSFESIKKAKETVTDANLEARFVLVSRPVRAVSKAIVPQETVKRWIGTVKQSIEPLFLAHEDGPASLFDAAVVSIDPDGKSATKGTSLATPAPPPDPSKPETPAPPDGFNAEKQVGLHADAGALSGLPVLHVTVLGERSVGKSTLLNYWANRTAWDDRAVYVPTTEGELKNPAKERLYVWEERAAKIVFHDSVGGVLGAMSPAQSAIIRASDALILVYGADDEPSLEALAKYKELVKGKPAVVAAHKADVETSVKVSVSTARSLAMTELDGAPVVQTSLKENRGIDLVIEKVFKALAAKADLAGKGFMAPLKDMPSWQAGFVRHLATEGWFTRSGWVEKKYESGWLKRWVEVKGGKLHYYAKEHKAEESSSKALKGRLRLLSDASVIRPSGDGSNFGRWEWRIQGMGRTLNFACETEDDRALWEAAVLLQIQAAAEEDELYAKRNAINSAQASGSGKK